MVASKWAKNGHKKWEKVSFFDVALALVAEGFEGCQRANFVSNFCDTSLRKKIR